MLLKEKLKELEGSNVKIGFDKGTNYVYCGEAFDGIAKLFKGLSEDELRKHKEKKAVLERKLFDGEIKMDIVARTNSNFYMEFVKVMSKMDIENEELPKTLAAKFYEVAEQCRKDEVRKDRNAYEQVTEELSKDPFGIMDREVVEVVDSVDELDTKIIMLDGDWVGKYWTTKECLKDNDLQRKIEAIKLRKGIRYL